MNTIDSNDKQIKVLNCTLEDIISGSVSKYDYQIDDLLFVEFNNELKKIVSSDDSIYIALLDDRLVGICILNPEKFITYICTDENHRNKGVATALSNCCITYNEIVYIRICKKDIGNIKVFQKIGFEFLEIKEQENVYSYTRKNI